MKNHRINFDKRRELRMVLKNMDVAEKINTISNYYNDKKKTSFSL